MPVVVAAFCRLVLGDPDAAAAATRAAAPGVDRVDEVAGAWLACGAELARRGDALSWEEPGVAAEGPPAVRALPALPDLERAAVVAQALGLGPDEVEQALGVEPGAAPGLLARAHAALAGLGRPAQLEVAAERERLAVAQRPRTAREDCREFATAVAAQRAQLRTAAGVDHRARSPAHLLEPAGRTARLTVVLAVLLLSGLVGFGAVSALERDDAGGDPGVVTATPVGPLPPGVGPTQP